MEEYRKIVDRRRRSHEARWWSVRMYSLLPAASASIIISQFCPAWKTVEVRYTSKVSESRFQWSCSAANSRDSQGLSRGTHSCTSVLIATCMQSWHTFAAPWARRKTANRTTSWHGQDRSWIHRRHCKLLTSSTNLKMGCCICRSAATQRLEENTAISDECTAGACYSKSIHETSEVMFHWLTTLIIY